ncbi:putative glucokinase [Atractiella rhizophila]|nr:putative glucokinase [Atractiella rhizophila]
MSAFNFLNSLPNDISQATKEVIESLDDSFAITDEKLKDIVKQFLWEYNQGLSVKITGKNAHTFLPMIPTFLSDTPDGTESGNFLALDLGGTNLRVCRVELKGDKGFSLSQEKYTVSEALKTGEAAALFDFIANCVDHFLTKYDLQATDEEIEEEKLHLGFTFSFPVQQTAIDKGTLIGWTKGFSATNAEGNDVVKLLQDALDRKHIHVHCSALVNDTVGTLMARAYQSGGAIIGAIFGTGTNGAYVQSIDKVKLLSDVRHLASMIINTEWGAFDNERRVLPFTVFDNKLDRESINPRRQAFEKMISGMYLGEIVRNVLLHLIDREIIFQGYSSKMLNTHYGFDTALMSKIEKIPLGHVFDVEPIKHILHFEVGVPQDKIAKEDCIIVARVCEIVGTRCARLAATAIATVLEQTNQAQTKGPISVGVDGSLVEHYPRFEERLRAGLLALVGAEVEERTLIGLAKDGSGVGAALCALQAKKQQDAAGVSPSPSCFSCR